MYISDELRVEGRLHANGESGSGSTGGGGSGGSILVYVSHLDGEGSIEATGGRGESTERTSMIKCFKKNHLKTWIMCEKLTCIYICM